MSFVEGPGGPCQRDKMKRVLYIYQDATSLQRFFDLNFSQVFNEERVISYAKIYFKNILVPWL
jgi:hypothetical protein